MIVVGKIGMKGFTGVGESEDIVDSESALIQEREKGISGFRCCD